MKYISLAFILFVCTISRTQHLGIDVQEYRISIGVTDSSDKITVEEWVEIRLTNDQDSIVLDLISAMGKGKGMTVSQVICEDEITLFTHKNNLLTIAVPKQHSSPLIHLRLYYSGIPDDGLIIGENKYHKRTFFGDNWPNRARHWIACNDHPSDKALFTFRVTAPEKYKVVAVGDFKGTEQISDRRMMSTYSSSTPLPTKVAVIGIAEMLWKEEATINGVKITSAVYPEKSTESFSDLAVAPKILKFYEQLLGPYEFEKLMNVQSTTRYGGMENAGCIFYDENALNGKGTAEELIAHEIAHQWFGNSLTETDWGHLWLSEGFATYMTNVYMEQMYGIQRFNKQMNLERSAVLSYSKRDINPLVDTGQRDPNDLLNTNTYKKGSWVLHMMRCKLGDSIFFKGLKDYYNAFRLSNADSDDLKFSFEKSSGIDLGSFFEDWLYKKGHPILRTSLQKGSGINVLHIEQTQEEVFQFDLTISFSLKNGIEKELTITVSKRDEKIKLPDFGMKIMSYKLDPNTELLFEEIE
jgi:aminopeptidase N